VYVPAGKSISSAPEPAGHSPGWLPDGESWLALLIASRNVQTPSSATTSRKLVTEMLPAETGLTEKALEITKTNSIIHLPGLTRCVRYIFIYSLWFISQQNPNIRLKCQTW
jgi:hypothetical protein